MQKLTSAKHLGQTLVVGLGSLLLAHSAIAQRPEGNRIPSPAERLEKMADQLNLSPDQRAKSKSVMEKSGPEIREIIAKGRQNASEAERTKVRDLLKTQSDEIASILTPEQREKFKQSREQRNGQPSPEERLQRMTSALSLTADQQAKVKSIMDTHGPKLREIMAKGRDNASDAEKEQAKELIKKQFEEIADVLTPEQKAKFKEFREQRASGNPSEKPSK